MSTPTVLKGFHTINGTEYGYNANGDLFELCDDHAVPFVGGEAVLFVRGKDEPDAAPVKLSKLVEQDADAPKAKRPASKPAKTASKGTVYTFGYGIPLKDPKRKPNFKTKFFFTKAKAERRAAKLADRGYVVTPVIAGPRVAALVAVAA